MDHEDKTAYAAKLLPQVSRQSQEYLKNLANAMLALQSTPSPVPDYKRQVMRQGKGEEERSRR
jgi:hypothetical protein